MLLSLRWTSSSDSSVLFTIIQTTRTIRVLLETYNEQERAKIEGTCKSPNVDNFITMTSVLYIEGKYKCVGLFIFGEVDHAKGI